jgi:predicted nicotinamide N-methyase
LTCYDFGDASVWIQQSSYAEAGLGWRVWSSAPRLSASLAARPSLLTGKAVLELGAGLGLVGLVASRLGAASVVLSEAPLPGLLKQLCANAALQPTNGCSVSVRSLLWEDDSETLLDDATMLAGKLRKSSAPESSCPQPLEPVATFDLVLGADILYDACQARPLAQAIATRMVRPSGRAMLALPVREPAVLDAFLEQLTSEGMRWSCVDVAGGGDRGEHCSESDKLLRHVDVDVCWT